MKAPLRSHLAFLALTFEILSGCATARRAVEPATAAPRAEVPPPPPAMVGQGGAPVPTSPPPERVRDLARVTLGAVGDVLMHEAVKKSAAAHGAGAPDAGFSWLFAPVADLLSQPDLTFANLETPIAPQVSHGSRAFVFNAPPEVISALQHAGVKLVSVANNHAFDQGRAGFEETLRWLDAAGMRYLGGGVAPHAAGPVRVDRNGLSLAFLGYTYGLNQTGNACPPPRQGAADCLQAAEIDRQAIVDDVRAAAATADAVVVSLHWGVEYEEQPRAADVELAHRLADAGALVVLGHHPHVLQPIELYRRADGRVAVIAYSLGNFVSNQSRNFVPGVTPEAVAATRDGVLFRVTLARRDYGRGAIRVEVVGADFLPLWTENDTNEIDRRKEPGRIPAIRVVADDRALAEVRAELERMPDPLQAEQVPRWIELREREALLLSRRAAVASLLGEDLLRVLRPEELTGRSSEFPTPAEGP
ncbi:MAG TPA: CapA family protein [Anaeromyxobacter sp.]|nr:CapA family protein [Anaeromyxobacter sp.]